MYASHAVLLSLPFFFHAATPFSVHAQMVMPAYRDESGYHAGTKAEIPIGGNLDELSDRLHLATPTQAVSLLEQLGVEPVIAKAAMQYPGNLPGIRLEAVPSQEAPVVTQNTKNALLFLPPAVQGAVGVYLLQRTKPGTPQGAWKATDHMLVAGFTSDVSYEIVHLGGMDTPLVALHRVNLSHGSDGTEDETGFYALRDGKLVELLHTPDYHSGQQWNSKDTSQDLEQQSSFTPFPDGSLEETRTSKLDGHWSKVERRFWHWKPTLGQFEPTSFEAVPPR